MFKNIILKIQNNKSYLIGLIGVIIISLVAMSVFFNKSIVNYDGWYNLYANDILNGRKPYTDFHFLMPPVFLYVWTLLQKIFGDLVIVSHTASMFCKTILLAVLYHTLTRFFNNKISFISTILTLAVMTTVIFDNCTFSYNEFATLLSLLSINALISFVQNLYKNRIKYIYIVLFAIINTLLFFTKQTHGIIVPFAQNIILLTILLRNKIKIVDILKIYGVYICTSFITVFLIFMPIISNFSLSAYIENVFLSASSKGSISDIFHVPLKIITRYEFLWPILTTSMVIFCMFIINKYNVCKFITGDSKTKSEWLPDNLFTFFILLSTLICSYFIALYLSKVTLLSGLVKSVSLASDQIGSVCEIAVLFIAIYYFLKTITAEKDETNACKLILVGTIFATALSCVLSTSCPSSLYYIYGLSLAILLNCQFKYSKIVNVIFYVLVIIALNLSLISKISAPIIFHGWQGLNITAERKISKLPFLKGMQLSKTEVDMYEDIYDTLNKYLKDDDKIFAFINNQVFYKLLNRKPYYNDHYSTYWDVCSENCAGDIYNKFNTDDLSQLPSAVIYFQYSDDSISFHEYLFRHNKKDNSQRKIDIKIRNDIANNRYKVIKTYDDKTYFMNNELLKDDFEKLSNSEEEYKKLMKNYEYENISSSKDWEKILDLEKNRKKLAKNFKHKLTDINSRFVIQGGFKLKVLIRKDIYDKGAK